MNDPRIHSLVMRFLALVGLGFSVNDAFDTVMGRDAYGRLAGELYDSLRGV